MEATSSSFSAGIIEGARATFYGSLIIGGLLLTVAGIALLIVERRGQQAVGQPGSLSQACWASCSTTATAP